MSLRSYEPITVDDLKRLRDLATKDRTDFFRRNPDTARLYADNLFAVALCQGAALHYLGGKNGIKDLDAWSFFRASPERPFPYRRRGILDFGDSKFGTSEDSPHFVGRRVDHIGRSIYDVDYTDPVAVLRRYLKGRATKSACFLAEKAMVLIAPQRLIGIVVWPVST